jgi:hypothetical protein
VPVHGAVQYIASAQTAVTKELQELKQQLFKGRREEEEKKKSSLMLYSSLYFILDYSIPKQSERKRAGWCWWVVVVLDG